MPLPFPLPSLTSLTPSHAQLVNCTISMFPNLKKIKAGVPYSGQDQLTEGWETKEKVVLTEHLLGKNVSVSSEKTQKEEAAGPTTKLRRIKVFSMCSCTSANSYQVWYHTLGLSTLRWWLKASWDL